MNVAATVPTIETEPLVRTSAIEEVESYINLLGAGDVLFLDVDDTLISPLTAMFRSASPDRKFIDNLKQAPHTVKDFPHLLGSWRLARKAQLVAKAWPSILKAAQEKGVLVHGLTMMETGPAGPIKRVEEWRYEELKCMDLKFTSDYGGKEDHVLLPSDKVGTSGVFYKGIFFTGGFSKGEILGEYLKNHRPNKIIFIDDRLEHVEDVAAIAMQHKIPVIGIMYQGAQLLPGAPDPLVSAVQKRLLIEDSVWLEDEEAAARLREEGD